LKHQDVTNANRAQENGVNGDAEKRSNAPSLMQVNLPAARNQNHVESRNPVDEVRHDPLSYQHMGPFDNIDERDADDPLCATTYVNDMYDHFRLVESRKSVRPLYMESQPQINERMRSILVDWLIEVHLKFKLVPETLYLTINLIDRYLERREVTRPKLQLVGVTSLLIAAKYEEIYPPELRDLVYICDRAYTRNEVSKNMNIFKFLNKQVNLKLSDHRNGRNNFESLGISNYYPISTCFSRSILKGCSRG
jgi:Cyclin, N-terminal domain